jgi:hypothetical protein
MCRRRRCSRLAVWRSNQPLKPGHQQQGSKRTRCSRQLQASQLRPPDGAATRRCQRRTVCGTGADGAGAPPGHLPICRPHCAAQRRTTPWPPAAVLRRRRWPPGARPPPPPLLPLRRTSPPVRRVRGRNGAVVIRHRASRCAGNWV